MDASILHTQFFVLQITQLLSLRHIFFICRNISQYVVFEKVNEKLQLLVEKLHSPLTAVPT